MTRPGRQVAPGLHIVAGGMGSDTADAELAQALVVEVGDEQANPLTGVLVTFQSTGGYGLTEPAVRVGALTSTNGGNFSFTTRSDRNGRAAVLVTLGEIAGTATVTVSTPTTGAQTSAVYTVLPGAPARVVVTPKDTSSYVGKSFPLSAVVQDRRGNPRPEVASLDYSASPTVLSGSNGNVVGQQIGRGYVVARYGATVPDTAWVSVVPNGVIAAYERPYYTSANNTLVVHPGHIVTLQLDGSEYRQVLEDNPVVPPPDYGVGPQPQWSSSGDTIAYVNTRRLLALDPNGNSRVITPDSVEVNSNYAPQYTVDGQWIYFTAQGSDLWRIHPDGTLLQRIPSKTYAPAATSPSPNGDRVVFGTAGPGMLNMLDLATDSLIPFPVPGLSPRWSPTGERIALLDNNAVLRTVRPDGTQWLIIGDGFGAHLNYGWSPDGRWLIYSAAAFGQYLTVGLYLVNVDTGLRLPLHFTRELVQPSWRR